MSCLICPVFEISPPTVVKCKLSFSPFALLINLSQSRRNGSLCVCEYRDWITEIRSFIFLIVFENEYNDIISLLPCISPILPIHPSLILTYDLLL